MICAFCGAPSSQAASYCSRCGRRLETAGEPPAAEAARSSWQGERRQLTVMFCDIVDWTHLSGRVDLEDLRDVTRAVQRVCSEAVERYAGRVAQLLGDGVLVYFGHPQAHEDDAIRAVNAALGVLAGIRELNLRLGETTPGLQDVQIQVRIGVHTGPVVLADVTQRQTRVMTPAPWRRPWPVPGRAR